MTFWAVFSVLLGILSLYVFLGIYVICRIVITHLFFKRLKSDNAGLHST
ncbi:MAG: hypothetical protein ACRD1R_21375 [Acidobacteriota bacterium]